MKHGIISMLAISISIGSFAQTTDDIAALANAKKFPEAKAAIDNYLAAPKNSGNEMGWYLKGYIYNNYSRETSVARDLSYQLKTDAFQAYKNYQVADKTELRLKAEGFTPYFDIYLGLYDLGGRQFDAKEYQGAYNSFTKAEEVENFILDKGYSIPELTLHRIDTGLLTNRAAAALQIADTATALTIYKKLTDANVSGKENQAVYEFVASYYASKKDEANFKAALAKGKSLYPNSNYWNELELSAMSGGDKEVLFARYDEVYRNNPDDFNSTYNYAVELFNYLYAREGGTTDSARQNRLTEVLKSAIAKDQGVDATNIMMNHLFNMAIDYSSQAARIDDKAGAAQQQKKKSLIAKTTAKMDEASPYIEKMIAHYKAKDKLTTKEKINLQQAYSNMYEIYSFKKNAAKAAEYEKLRDGIKF